MKKYITVSITVCVASMIAGGALISGLNAAEGKDPTKEFMKLYHKAPKGTDPVCKKATDGKASKTELTQLVAGYKAMCSASLPAPNVVDGTLVASTPGSTSESTTQT